MRLFLAASLPTEVLGDLNDRVAHLKPRLPSASWVRPETQHLTFAFLGEHPESLVPVLADPLTKAVQSVASFEARVRGVGFFPNARRARVGWAGLDPEAAFVRLAEVVRSVVKEEGVELDGDFKPHLTLMRMKDVWPPASIDLFCRTLRDYVSAPFPMREVTLFSSELHPKGAIHTALRTFGLA